MRFNKLDMNLLVALDALLVEGSITRAATRLNLSVSATSHALGRLREYFGDDLLRQVGRRMELTQLAHELQAPIRDVLERVDMTILSLRPFDPSRSDREMKICASDYTQQSLGPFLMAAAAAQRSQVQLHFVPQLPRVLNDLERGECDLLILPAGFGSALHPEEPLMEDTFSCLVWQGSPLAQGALTMERYTAAAHVVMQPYGTRVPSVEALMAQQMGVTRRIAATTYSFGSIPALVVGTPHIATMHHRMAVQAARAYPLVIKAPPLSLPSVRQIMQWHTNRTRDPALVWLKGLLKLACQQMIEAMEQASPPCPQA
jgi:LysR family transcriptional regulator, nod-box dependent transcriptional activator